MRRKRHIHAPEFKSKVALTAIKSDLTIAELVNKFDIHANLITEWKKQLLYGAPEIFNTDRGSQFTSEEFTSTLKRYDIQISMYGKGRWVENVFA
jgi:transposase